MQRAARRLPRGALREPGGASTTSPRSSTSCSTARASSSCRLLGGRRGWPEGVDRAARAAASATASRCSLLGGEAEPDAELAELSLAPAGAVAQAFEYLRHGGVDNIAQLLRFLADTFAARGPRLRGAARAARRSASTCPARGDVELEEALAGHDAGRPTVGVVFYRSHRLTGNTAFVDALAAAIEAAGGDALCVWSYSLRPDADGRVPALELLDGRGRRARHDRARLGRLARRRRDGVATRRRSRRSTCRSSRRSARPTSRARWEESDPGLTPLDAAMQVAIPEFDGRILGGADLLQGARSTATRRVGAPVLRYAPDPERCARLARLAVRHARLRARCPRASSASRSC